MGCEGIEPHRHPPDLILNANGATIRRQEHSPYSIIKISYWDLLLKLLGNEKMKNLEQILNMFYRHKLDKRDE